MRSSVSRRGLYDIDGRQLDDIRAGAAYFGSVADIDVVRLSVADAVNNICGDEISRMCLERCLEDGHWPPDWWSEALRYADDIMADWGGFGSPSIESLHDTCLAAIGSVREVGSRLPRRPLPPNECFVGGTIGGAPKSIYPASPAPAYVPGQGHSALPDGVTHPLILHLASGEPCTLKPMLAGGNDGYTPHRRSGCDGLRRPAASTPKQEPRGTPSSAAQREKVAAIRDMVGDVKPGYASLYETGCRHSLLVHGNGIDAVSVGVAAAEIRERFGTPLDCMVTDDAALDDLLGDAGGNDAKLIVRGGSALAGIDPTFQDPSGPPRPAAFTRNEMFCNMERHGFGMIGPPPDLDERPIRPEYVITATHFSMEPRWFIAGVAVMLCSCRINWRLLMYLAGVYGYEGTLYGVTDSLCRQGRDFWWPVDVWRGRGIGMVPTEDDTIRDALRVYRR